jgi:hypothetical protein
MSEVFRKSLMIAASAILAALVVAAHGYRVQSSGLTSNFASLPHA